MRLGRYGETHRSDARVHNVLHNVFLISLLLSSVYSYDNFFFFHFLIGQCGSGSMAKLTVPTRVFLAAGVKQATCGQFSCVVVTEDFEVGGFGGLFEMFLGEIFFKF